MAVIIIGARIGGLMLALGLHKANIAMCVHEAAPKIQPLGESVVRRDALAGMAHQSTPRRA